MLYIHLFYFLLIKSVLIHGESFTSITHLTYLFDTEVELAKQLEGYLQSEYDRLDRIEKYTPFFT